MFALARLKLYATGAAVFIAAFLGVYYRGRADGRDDLEYERKDDRLDKLMAAKEVQHELQHISDDDIAARAGRWVRSDNSG
jgi:hypothetical protein